MASHRKYLLSILLLLAAAFGLLLPACNGSGKTGLMPTQAATLETPAEPTAIPSPTTAPGKVWLVSPSGSDSSLLRDIQSKLTELASQANFTMSRQENLTAANLDSSAKVVVWIGENADLTALASAFPQTQFISISANPPETAANVNTIDLSPERASFVAGLIATLVAPDRRSGGLFSTDDPLNAQLQNAFANGGAYFCGRCVPVYAPVVFFPVTTAVPSSGGLDAWKAGFEQLNQNRIEVLYTVPQAISPEFLTYLAGLGVKVLGVSTPPDGFTNSWIATVHQDPVSALEALWPDLIREGAAGKAVIAPLALTDVNSQLLTPGKQELVEKVIADLEDGWIEPLSVP